MTETTTTNEVIEAKAKELSLKHNCKVIPFAFKGDNESDLVIGYIKELPRHVKLALADKLTISPVSSCAEVLEHYLIREESDTRITSEDSDNDKYYMGVINIISNMIQISINQLKKK